MRFRKKPVEVEAQRFAAQTHAAAEALAAWCGGEFCYYVMEPGNQSSWWIAIKTLEGTMKAVPGDWIIRGVQGEFYPCKPDIFEATYEPA